MSGTPTATVLAVAIEVGASLASVTAFTVTLWLAAVWIGSTSSADIKLQAIVYMVENSLRSGAPGLPPSKPLSIGSAPVSPDKLRIRLGIRFTLEESRIDVASADVPDRIRHRKKRQPESERYPYEADAQMRKARSQNRCAASAKHQPERADEFSS